jgi:rhamnulokinase
LQNTYYLACDLGAESGRVMLGTLSNDRVTLEEIHRFPSAVIQHEGSLRWDTDLIFASLKKGVRIALERDLPISSLSVDSWGVDYVLVGRNGEKLANPHHYRDERTDEVFPRVRQTFGDDFIFSCTGIQFMPFNTLFQLVAEQETNPALLAEAATFLTMGDYFNYLFSGEAAIEESLASTTQLYDPKQRQWSKELIARAGFPPSVFPKIVPSGTVLGNTQAVLGDKSLQVIATCSHDTGAAVAAVPAESGEDWAYLSSGTWSLLGVELSAPNLSSEVLAHNFTNEAGYGGTTRFLKNIVGLWILQECRRTWATENQDYSYAWLMEQAAAAEPLRSLISPSDPRFMKPGEMPEKIVAYCRETQQPAPETPGQFTRCILESLALLYRQTVAEIESLTGRKLRRIHIVGGGSQSELLNQLSADATGLTVVAGPIEATAIGNVLVQALSLGHVESLQAARALVAQSFSVITYQPHQTEAWREAYARITHL